MTAERTATAMILAAGLGTRLKPLTDTMPKALVPYEGVPMIQRLMLQLKKAGFTRAVINVHHFADMLEEFVRSHAMQSCPDCSEKNRCWCTMWTSSLPG